MANKKFSEFDLSVNVGSVSELVGLNGTRNVKITPTNLLADVNETISLLDDRVILNDAKVGITQQQADDILTNNDKVGITQQQASDIATNTTAISTEVTDRTNADAVLQGQINSNFNTITGLINMPNGIAGLDSNGDIDISLIPETIVTQNIFSSVIDNGGTITSTNINATNLDVSNQATVSSIKSFSLSTFFTIPPGTPVEWYSFNVPSKSGMFSIEGNGNVAIYHFTTASDGELRISETPIGFFGNQDMQCFVVNYSALHIFNFFFEPFAGTLTLKILYLD